MHDMKEGHDCAGGICEDGKCEGGKCEGGKCCGSSRCGCWHHQAMGILLVLLGLTFLMGALNVIDGETVNVIWPVIVVIAGLKKLFAGMCKCC